MKLLYFIINKVTVNRILRNYTQKLKRSCSLGLHIYILNFFQYLCFLDQGNQYREVLAIAKQKHIVRISLCTGLFDGHPQKTKPKQMVQNKKRIHFKQEVSKVTNAPISCITGAKTGI